MFPLSSGSTRPVKTKLIALTDGTSVDRPGSNVAISGTPASGKINTCLFAAALECGELVVVLLPPPPQAASSNAIVQNKAGKTVEINFFPGRICIFLL